VAAKGAAMRRAPRVVHRVMKARNETKRIRAMKRNQAEITEATETTRDASRECRVSVAQAFPTRRKRVRSSTQQVLSR
jgi:hypothetical protein